MRKKTSRRASLEKGVIQIVAGWMLHSKVISKGYISLTITKSCKDDYPLLDFLNEGDPPKTTIGKGKENKNLKIKKFVVWPIDCLSLYEAT